MSYFYEIKKDSTAYDGIVDAEKMLDHWREPDIQKDICEFLQVESINNEIGLATIPYELCLLCPPEHLKEQFLKNPGRHGYYKAKKGLDQRWIQFCENKGLTSVDYWFSLLSCFRNEWGAGKKFIYRLNGRYILESTSQLNEECLEGISEIDFLELRLVFLKEKKKLDTEANFLESRVASLRRSEQTDAAAEAGVCQ